MVGLYEHLALVIVVAILVVPLVLELFVDIAILMAVPMILQHVDHLVLYNFPIF